MGTVRATHFSQFGAECDEGTNEPKWLTMPRRYLELRNAETWTFGPRVLGKAAVSTLAGSFADMDVKAPCSRSGRGVALGGICLLLAAILDFDLCSANSR